MHAPFRPPEPTCDRVIRRGLPPALVLSALLTGFSLRGNFAAHLPSALLQFIVFAISLAVLIGRSARWWQQVPPRSALFLTALAAVLITWHPGGTSSEAAARSLPPLRTAALQHRAIFEDHELPLWNRSDDAGVTLLGQGRTMIGDPLHWITIAAAGAPWSWEVKWNLARLLFAFGVGLLVHAFTRSLAGSLGLAALLGAVAAFIGFATEPFDPGVMFGICYAPWILLGWLVIARGGGLAAAILLTVALGMESQSGTIRGAMLVIGSLSLIGAGCVLFNRESSAERLRRFGLGLAAVAVFLLASAPTWRSYFDSLDRTGPEQFKLVASEPVPDSPALEYVVAHQVEPSRVASFGDPLPPDVELEHFGGAVAVRNFHYAELLAAAGIPTTHAQANAIAKPSYPALRPIYDLLGIRWILGPRHDPSPDFSGLVRRAALDREVFESPTAWPRAFFTDRLSTYDTAADFTALVAASDGRPFAALQRTGPGVHRDWSLPDDQATRQIVPALAYQLTSNRTGLAIETPGPGLVVLGEAWLDEDFHVTLDGKLTPYLRVNHAFRGVWVGKSGRHWIEFSYRPRSLKPAAGLAAIGLIFLCSALAVVLRRGVVE